MTADQTIALISSIGTCLSAIATFLTIRQIAKQREASYRPELAFSRTFFVAEPDPIRAGALPEKWVNKKLGLETPMLLDDLSVPLRNVGLGTAKAITISWSFPIDQTLPIRLVHPLFASGYMQKGEDDNPTGHRIARDKLVQLHSRRY
ncbi:MAG: hypothetical protein PHI11_09620, partial [Gallionella sp.]|nr:hypothetical protein [Gallionella sp.]